MVQDLHSLRHRIEEIDRAVLNLICRRTTLAGEIGRVKKRLGLPISDPSRETAILEGLKNQPHTPLSDNEIDQLFSLIFQFSKHIQQNPEQEDDHCDA